MSHTNIRGVKTRNRRKILKSMLKTLKVNRNKSATSPKKENKPPRKRNTEFDSIFPSSSNH